MHSSKSINFVPGLLVEQNLFLWELNLSILQLSGLKLHLKVLWLSLVLMQDSAAFSPS
jgi:hypothetical protein